MTTYDGKPQPLTRQQKAMVAQVLLSAAGMTIEHWHEQCEIAVGEEPCSADLAAQQMATWLQRLPGDGWDVRLPIPGNHEQVSQ